MVRVMADPALHVSPARVSSDGLSTLNAMAALSRQTDSVIHVVVPRAPGVVQYAHAVADQASVDVELDLMPFTIRARFAPRAQS
jgi:hypothetical protein